MSIKKMGSRAGAAAFALGLSLAAPHGTGIACAESADDGKSPTSTSAGAAANSAAPSNDSAHPRKHYRTTGTRTIQRSSTETREIDEHTRTAAVDERSTSVEQADASESSVPSPSASSLTTLPLSPLSANKSAPSEERLTQDSDREPTLRKTFKAIDSQSPLDISVTNFLANSTFGATIDLQESSSLTSIFAGAAVTAGGLVGPGTINPIASTPTTPARPLAALDAAVTNFFDSVSRWLADLPANSITTWIEGALLTVRRTFFNHAPTGSAIQYGRLATSQVIGKIDAIDPEGDPVTYQVVENPQFGTVHIDASGRYLYTPDANFEGTDSFVVAIDNPGARVNVLGSDPGPTLVTAEIASSVTDLPIVGWATRGFDVYNFTSRTLIYKSGNNDDLSGPQLGTVLKPGENVHFELNYYGGPSAWGYPQFEVFDDSYGQGTADTWKLELEVGFWGNSYVEGCATSAGCIYDENDSDVYLTDRKSTIIDIPAGKGQKQAEALNEFCASGGAAACSFIPRNGQKMFSSNDIDDNAYSPAKMIEPGFTNDTTSPMPFTQTYSASQSQTSSIDFSLDTGVNIYGIVSASVHRNSNQSWTNSWEYSTTVNYQINEGETLTVEVQYPVITVVGDFIVKLGNTTFRLRDIEFSTPDKSRNSKVIFATTRKEPAPNPLPQASV